MQMGREPVEADFFAELELRDADERRKFRKAGHSNVVVGEAAVPTRDHILKKSVPPVVAPIPRRRILIKRPPVDCELEPFRRNKRRV